MPSERDHKPVGKRINVMIDEDIGRLLGRIPAARLDALAEDSGRPRDWLVKEAIQAYLDLEDERRRETIAALRSVDAGALVEHSEVEAWVRGLRSASKPTARV